MLASSRAYQASTNVTTNHTANRMAVMTRFFRQYSSCLWVSCMVSSRRSVDRNFPERAPSCLVPSFCCSLAHRSRTLLQNPVAMVRRSRRNCAAADLGTGQASELREEELVRILITEDDPALAEAL